MDKVPSAHIHSSTSSSYIELTHSVYTASSPHSQVIREIGCSNSPPHTSTTSIDTVVPCSLTPVDKINHIWDGRPLPQFRNQGKPGPKASLCRSYSKARGKASTSHAPCPIDHDEYQWKVYLDDEEKRKNAASASTKNNSVVQNAEAELTVVTAN
ncbi:hypothetical protein LguiB_005795 [Lonicera macranthoides]